MCWMSRMNPKAIVAKEDINILKVVASRGDILRPYFIRYDPKFLYTKNETTSLVHIEVRNIADTCFVIEKGYHSYGISTKYNVTYDRIIVGTTTYRELLQERIHLIECIIPKDTTYYVNENNECVSERIKLCKILASVGG